MIRKTKSYQIFSLCLAAALFILCGQSFGNLFSKKALSEIGDITPGVSDTWTSDASYYVTPTYQDGVYHITKPEELADIATGSGRYNTTCTFSLDADLDMSAHEWVPIPIINYITFEGNGHTISNLTVNQPGTDHVGFFAQGGGFMKNLTLANVNFTGKNYVGGFFGQANANGGIISNCTVSSGSLFGYGKCIGGIVGESNNLSIDNCKNYASVQGLGDDVAGIAGYSYYTITNCFNGGDITGAVAVGGIVGYCFDAEIKNCYVECTLTTTDVVVGGIAGDTKKLIENCAFRGKIISTKLDSECIGGLIGGDANKIVTDIKNCFSIAEIVTNNSDNSTINIKGAPSNRNFYNSYAFTKVINKSNVSEYRRYTKDTNSFQDWHYNPNINGGFPFPAGMFAVGGVIPEQDVEAYLQSFNFSEGLEIKYLDNSTYGTNYYVELGKYPQTYVGSSMNTTLEGWYSGKTVVDTYTVDNGVYNAYTYIDGKTYVRVPNPIVYSTASGSITQSKYEDGTAATSNATWFTVEPIKWLILNYTDVQNGAASVVVAEKAITASAWNKSTGVGNLWSEISYIRSWLKGTFYNNAFSSADKGNIVETTLQNNSQSSDNDGAGNNTTDKVWLLSYNEANGKYFTTDKQRLCSPTDFAVANYCSLYTSTSYPTTARSNGGTCYWWLRSAYPSITSSARNVSRFGSFNNSNVNISTYAVRPALTIIL